MQCTVWLEKQNLLSLWWVISRGIFHGVGLCPVLTLQCNTQAPFLSHRGARPLLPVPSSAAAA